MRKPYFGQDIDRLEQSCSSHLREHDMSEPVEDLAAFNPNVRGFGQVWAEVCEKGCGLFVIAGLTGNMSGVPIAQFGREHRAAAAEYAKDFQSGKVFTIANDERWCDYVNAAQAVKPLSTQMADRLLALGRKSGYTISGRRYSQSELLGAYEAGEISWES